MGTVSIPARGDILLPHIHFRARIQIDIFYRLSVGQFLASLEENIIYDSNNNDSYLAGQRSNCQFGKSTLRQKVWKFTVDKLTNGQPSLCRYYQAGQYYTHFLRSNYRWTQHEIIKNSHTALPTFTICFYSSHHCKHQHMIT